MGTVTGLTAARMLAIEAASVVSGIVTGNNLILTKHDGTTIDAGNVRGPKGDKGDTGNTGSVTALTAWPVGSIFMSVVATDPNTLLGGGTWVRWGQGRVPVSLDSTQTEFDAVEETGGEKTHILTIAEMPAHNHTQTVGSGGNTSNTTRASGAGSAGTGVTAGALVGQIDNTGGGGAHNNLQPYITCYMWKRTA